MSTHALQHVVAALCLPLLAAGCQVELPKPTDIQFDRPLGARASVIDADDPLRATPAPGERVRYEVAIAFDEPLGRDLDAITSLFIVCTAPEQFTGIPICLEFLEGGAGFGPPAAGAGQDTGGPAGGAELACEGPDFVQSLGPFTAACVSGAPALEFSIEPDFTAAAKLVIGILCQGGTPYLDMEADSEQLLRCRDNDGEAMDVYGTVPVWQPDDEPNLNPDLSALEISLGPEGATEPWLPPDEDSLPQQDCAREAPAPELPLLSASADKPHRIAFAYDPAAITDRVDGERETMEIGAHATIEGIERLFTLFQPDKDLDEDGNLAAELEFEVADDEELLSGGQLVRFFFTARDRRGGFDLTERVACVRD